jgi:hypothetical protein
MTGGENASKQKRCFALTSSAILILSILLIGISIPVPDVMAEDHDVGNLKIKGLTDIGRIYLPLEWNGKYQTVQDPISLGFIGLVVDHSQYDHTPGSENIADSFIDYPYFSSDDFEAVKDITMLMDDGITHKITFNTPFKCSHRP